MEKVKKRCAWCGKEFYDFDITQCCCQDHRYLLNTTKTKIKSKIRNVAKRFDFDVQNLDKIVNAKIRFFKDGDYTRCPCDADNPERYCGSALCISDVVTKGHCHCHLFHKKDKAGN